MANRIFTSFHLSYKTASIISSLGHFKT